MRVSVESGRPLKKGALKVLIGAVAISAVLGVWAMLAEFSEVQIRVLFTAFAVAGASIIALACGAALELGRSRLLAPIGIWCSVIGCGLAIIGVWFEISAEFYLRTMTSVILAAFFAGHTCAMSAANLSRRHVWVRWATMALSAILLLIFLSLTWSSGWDEFPWRLTGVLVVLASAGTILVPVLGRMGRSEFVSVEAVFSGGGDVDIGQPPTATASELPHCPHCGEELPASLKQAFP